MAWDDEFNPSDEEDEETAEEAAARARARQRENTPDNAPPSTANPTPDSFTPAEPGPVGAPAPAIPPGLRPSDIGKTDIGGWPGTEPRPDFSNIGAGPSRGGGFTAGPAAGPGGAVPAGERPGGRPGGQPRGVDPNQTSDPEAVRTAQKQLADFEAEAQAQYSIMGFRTPEEYMAIRGGGETGWLGNIRNLAAGRLENSFGGMNWGPGGWSHNAPARAARAAPAVARGTAGTLPGRAVGAAPPVSTQARDRWGTEGAFRPAAPAAPEPRPGPARDRWRDEEAFRPRPASRY